MSLAGTELCRIRRGLYIGSWWTEQRAEAQMKAEGITHVLQVAQEVRPSHKDTFKYLSLRVEDEPYVDLAQQFKTCFAFIDEALAQEGGVLVHCIAGISRSATVCIGYLMWKDKVALQAAFQEVYQARSCISPNMGFLDQLRKFERLGSDPDKWDGWQPDYSVTPSRPLLGSFVWDEIEREDDM